jgi:Flp pilus assembly protein TadD
LAIILEKEG